MVPSPVVISMEKCVLFRVPFEKVYTFCLLVLNGEQLRL